MSSPLPLLEGSPISSDSGLAAVEAASWEQSYGSRPTPEREEAVFQLSSLTDQTRARRMNSDLGNANGSGDGGPTSMMAEGPGAAAGHLPPPASRGGQDSPPPHPQQLMLQHAAAAAAAGPSAAGLGPDLLAAGTPPGALRIPGVHNYSPGATGTHPTQQQADQAAQITAQQQAAEAALRRQAGELRQQQALMQQQQQQQEAEELAARQHAEGLINWLDTAYTGPERRALLPGVVKSLFSPVAPNPAAALGPNPLAQVLYLDVLANLRASRLTLNYYHVPEAAVPDSAIRTVQRNMLEVSREQVALMTAAAQVDPAALLRLVTAAQPAANALDAPLPLPLSPVGPPAPQPNLQPGGAARAVPGGHSEGSSQTFSFAAPGTAVTGAGQTAAVAAGLRGTVVHDERQQSTAVSARPTTAVAGLTTAVAAGSAAVMAGPATAVAEQNGPVGARQASEMAAAMAGASGSGDGRQEAPGALWGDATATRQVSFDCPALPPAGTFESLLWQLSRQQPALPAPPALPGPPALPAQAAAVSDALRRGAAAYGLKYQAPSVAPFKKEDAGKRNPHVFLQAVKRLADTAKLDAAQLLEAHLDSFWQEAWQAQLESKNISSVGMPWDEASKMFVTLVVGDLLNPEQAALRNLIGPQRIKQGPNEPVAVYAANFRRQVWAAKMRDDPSDIPSTDIITHLFVEGLWDKLRVECATPREGTRWLSLDDVIRTAANREAVVGLPPPASGSAKGAGPAGALSVAAVQAVAPVTPAPAPAADGGGVAAVAAMDTSGYGGGRGQQQHSSRGGGGRRGRGYGGGRGGGRHGGGSSGYGGGSAPAPQQGDDGSEQPRRPVPPDDVCRNCGGLGHHSYQCPTPSRGGRGRGRGGGYSGGYGGGYGQRWQDDDDYGGQGHPKRGRYNNNYNSNYGN